MSAWRIHAYGEKGNPQDTISKMTLERVPVPEPAEGQVLIRVDMAAMNQVDWKLFSGGMDGMAPVTFPSTPSFDLAGVVVKVGPGTSTLAVGDKVCANLGVMETCQKDTPVGPGGACGEYAVAFNSTVSKREGLVAKEVAGLALAGTTSYQALVTGAGVSSQGTELGQLEAGQKVLILGGASGTGCLAVQIAKSLGAYVATTASENKTPDGRSKMEFVKALGADLVIDYKKDDWSEVLKGQAYDLIYDCAGDGADLKKASKVLKKKASFVSIANYHGSSTPEVSFKGMFVKSNAADLGMLVALMAEGKLTVPIDTTFSFDQVPAGYLQSMGSASAGKILVQVRGGSRASTKVLVTGGSGYLGSWCVKMALDRGYTVHTTVRSEEKAAFLKSLPGAAERLKVFGGVDLLGENAFDEAMAGCEFVLQTASPFYFEGGSEEKLVKPAVDGIKNVLGSATKLGVKKVVVTSSMASVMVSKTTQVPWTGEHWSDEEFMRETSNWYCLSKTVQERTAWEMSKQEGCPWKMCTINPCLIFGPMVPGQPALNTSSNLCLKFFDGGMTQIQDGFCPLVDVRDVAEAHVAALDIEEALGKRYVMVADVPHNRAIAALVREAVPEHLKAKVPTEEEQKDVPPTPSIVQCSPTADILEIRMRKTAGMVKDMVAQMIQNGFESSEQYVPDK